MYLLLYKKVAGVILFNLSVPKPDMCGKLITKYSKNKSKNKSLAD